MSSNENAAASGADTSEDSRISVAIRCRPLSESEKSSNVTNICRVMDQRLVLLLDPGVAASNDYLRQNSSKEKRFAFDQAFGPEVGTQQLFEATMKNLIASVLQGYNGTVFAYGSTGAGKTFTMIGNQQEPGIMLRTVDAIFAGAKGQPAFSIICSFVEVYNEHLRDLGSKDGSDGILDLREDPITGTSVAGVTEVLAQSVQEVMDMLQHGNQRRTTEPTAMNVTSSRSHAVLQVRVERRELGNPNAGVLVGKLSMIDLAGSERASQTNNSGIRLLEGANINRSLLALGNCINALASGSPFVPFRDSKLTRLLKDSLGGNCRTVMVANISPCHHSYDDTLNTLKYANRAKNIRVSAKQNLIKPDDHVSQYEQAISDLQNEVSILKAKLVQRTAPQAHVQDAADDQERESELQKASEVWKVDVIRNLEGRTSLQRSLIDIERGLVQWRVELEQAKDVIAHWDPNNSSPASPSNRRGFGTQLQSLDEWKDQVSQIEENIRENIETRRSLAERLQQNKAAGKDLQSQLPRRVLNEDLRAFLVLIQRVQVLEVERLELDHFWEIHRRQLENSDAEIEMLREQLKLRNSHIHAQREQLSKEKQEQLPGRVSLLGSTLAESSPSQQRGPLRVMQAWAPTSKEAEELQTWDSRPLRERPPASRRGTADAAEEGNSEESHPPLPMQDNVIDWRALEVPLASQIKGLAQLQQDGTGRLLPKSFESLGLRSIPESRAAEPSRPTLSLAANGVAPPPMPTPSVRIAGTGLPRAGNRSPPQRRGNTCPPMQRKLSLEPPDRQMAGQMAQLAEKSRQPSSMGDVRNPPAAAPVRGLLRAHGVAPAASREPRSLDKGLVGTPYRVASGRTRARSEHSSRMVRAGRIMVQTPGR